MSPFPVIRSIVLVLNMLLRLTMVVVVIALFLYYCYRMNDAITAAGKSNFPNL
jgi:hypothetical protein